MSSFYYATACFHLAVHSEYKSGVYCILFLRIESIHITDVCIYVNFRLNTVSLIPCLSILHHVTIQL